MPEPSRAALRPCLDIGVPGSGLAEPMLRFAAAPESRPA
jgi:hypothetical protein